MLAVLAAVTLAGCGKAPEPPQASKPITFAEAPLPRLSRQPPSRSAIPTKKLNLFCWSEYVPQEIIDAFTKETGIKVSVESYASNEEMLAKLLAGGGNL